MLVHNSSNFSRFCLGLNETLEAHETRDVENIADCPHCRCVVITDAPKKKAADPAEEK